MIRTNVVCRRIPEKFVQIPSTKKVNERPKRVGAKSNETGSREEHEKKILLARV